MNPAHSVRGPSHVVKAGKTPVLSPEEARTLTDSIEVSTIAGLRAEPPHRQEIVAYCRGPYCVLSFEAVAELRARGFNVRRLEQGFPEWKAAGLPIEAVA